MNLGASQAARWQATQTRARMGASIWWTVVKFTLIAWVLLTIGVIWYGTGRDSPQLHHRYFWRWIFCGIFSDVPILNILGAHMIVPLEGHWYPLPYAATWLNGTNYYEASFGLWFSHYCKYTALVPAAFGSLALLIRLGRDSDAEHLRGLRLLRPRRHNHQLNGGWWGKIRRFAHWVVFEDPPSWRPIRLGSSIIPLEKDCEHFLVTGNTGAGKSVLIGAMLRQIAARGQVAVVVDPESEYIREFYNPERGDAVLNPLDERCPYWSPWSEFRRDQFTMDTAALASSFIRANPNPMADGSSDSFFRTSSRTLLESISRAVQPHEPEAIKTLLAQSREQIKKALIGTPAAPLIDPQAHDQGAGIIATAANAVKPLEYLPARNTSPRTWGARSWAEQPGSWLFLASTEDSRSAVAPLQAAWMDTIIRWLMTHESGDAPVWIIIDELSTLGYLPELERMVVRGRKRGLCVVMGFQNVSQLRSAYGRDRATTLISAPSTKVIMRCDEAETAKWASELLGSREIERINMTALTGLSTYREGMNLQSHRSNEHIVTPAEIQLLKPFQGYLCVAGHDRTTLKIPPLYLKQTHPGFTPRRTRATTIREQSAGAITAEDWLN
jgi:hypothetical protein